MARHARLRVLYLQPSEFFGGEERQLVTSIPHLAAHGIDATALVGPGRTLLDWLARGGVTDVVFSPDFPGASDTGRGLARLALPLRYRRGRAAVAATVARVVRERRIDLIYASMPFSWAAATPVARRLGIPIVWRAGGPVWFGGPLLGSIALAPWAMRNPPDLLVCSTDAVRATFRGLVPARKEAVLNGVDTHHFFPGAGNPAALRPPDATVVVGFAGRMVATKGLGGLLEVAGAMARTHPGVRFLVGGDGSRRRHFEARARACGAAANTRFLGYVPDMRAFYAACDVFTLPSRREGASMGLLEAMASGCAVVASDNPSLSEIVRPGRDGLLARCGDTKALHAVLTALCDTPDLRAALAGAAVARVRAELTAERCAARIAELLHAVAARRDSASDEDEKRAGPARLDHERLREVDPRLREHVQ